MKDEIDGEFLDRLAPSIVSHVGVALALHPQASDAVLLVVARFIAWTPKHIEYHPEVEEQRVYDAWDTMTGAPCGDERVIPGKPSWTEEYYFEEKIRRIDSELRRLEPERQQVILRALKSLNPGLHREISDFLVKP